MPSGRRSSMFSPPLVLLPPTLVREATSRRRRRRWQARLGRCAIYAALQLLALLALPLQTNWTVVRQTHTGVESFGVLDHRRRPRGCGLLVAGGAPFKHADRPAIQVGAARKKSKDAADADGDLAALTVAELKKKLQERGLPVSGRKAELIARLEQGEEQDDGREEELEAKPKSKGTAKNPAKPDAKMAPVGRSIEDGDTVYFKAWTGKYLDFSEHHADVKARGTERGLKEAMIIEKPAGGKIRAGDTIFLKSKKRDEHIDVLGSAVRVRYNDQGDWQQLRITRQSGDGEILSGDTIFLRGHQEMTIDVQDIDVRARWPDEGDWQQLVLEVDE